MRWTLRYRDSGERVCRAGTNLPVVGSRAHMVEYRRERFGNPKMIALVRLRPGPRLATALAVVEAARGIDSDECMECLSEPCGVRSCRDHRQLRRALAAFDARFGDSATGGEARDSATGGEARRPGT